MTTLCEFKPGVSLKVLFRAYIGLYKGCRGYIGCRADHSLGYHFWVPHTADHSVLRVYKGSPY